MAHVPPGQHMLHELAADKWFMPRFRNFLKLSGDSREERERERRDCKSKRERKIGSENDRKIWEIDKWSSKWEL